MRRTEHAEPDRAGLRYVAYVRVTRYGRYTDRARR